MTHSEVMRVATGPSCSIHVRALFPESSYCCASLLRSISSETFRFRYFAIFGVHLCNTGC